MRRFLIVGTSNSDIILTYIFRSFEVETYDEAKEVLDEVVDSIKQGNEAITPDKVMLIEFDDIKTIKL